MHIFKSNMSILFVMHLIITKAFLSSSLKGPGHKGRLQIELKEYPSALSQNVSHFHGS